MEIFIWWSEYRRGRPPVQHNRIEICITNQLYGHRTPAGLGTPVSPRALSRQLYFQSRHATAPSRRESQTHSHGRHGTSRCQQKHHRGTRLQWSECILPALPAGSGTARTTRVFASVSLFSQPSQIGAWKM